MERYVVCNVYMKPSRKKGKFPDVIYEYIAYDFSLWHYTFTTDIENAYIFENNELDDAKEIAYLWNMKVIKI